MCSPFQNVIWHAIRSFPPGEFLQKEQHFRCGLSVEKGGPTNWKMRFPSQKILNVEQVFVNLSKKDVTYFQNDFFFQAKNRKVFWTKCIVTTNDDAASFEMAIKWPSLDFLELNQCFQLLNIFNKFILLKNSEFLR